MRFSVDAALFRRVCALLHPIVARKNTIPILENVLIEVHGDRLKASVNNLTMGMAVSLEARGQQDGAVTVSAQRLKAIADAAAHGAELSFAELDSGQVEVRSGRSRFVLATLPAADYPALIRVKKDVEFELDAGEMQRLLAAKWAAGTDDARYYLNGIYLHRRDKQLVAIATDAHRLAFIPRELPAGAEAMPEDGYIVPLDTVNALTALVGDKACRVGFSSNAVEVGLSGDNGIGDLLFSSKLVEGTYPDYQRVIPAAKDQAGCALVNSDRLQRALKGCSVALSAVEDPKGKAESGVRLRFHGALLSLEAKGGYGELASDEMDISWTGSSANDYGINWKYLMGAVDATGAKEVRLFPGDGAPLRIEPAGEDGRIFVVMGMRL